MATQPITKKELMRSAKELITEDVINNINYKLKQDYKYKNQTININLHKIYGQYFTSDEYIFIKEELKKLYPDWELELWGGNEYISFK